MLVRTVQIPDPFKPPGTKASTSAYVVHPTVLLTPSPFLAEAVPPRRKGSPSSLLQRYMYLFHLSCKLTGKKHYVWDTLCLLLTSVDQGATIPHIPVST